MGTLQHACDIGGTKRQSRGVHVPDDLSQSQSVCDRPRKAIGVAAAFCLIAGAFWLYDALRGLRRGQ